MNEILAIPNPLYLATGVEGSFEIGGSALYPAWPQACHRDEFDVHPNLVWDSSGAPFRIQKVAGSADGSPAICQRRIPVEQPLWTNGGYGTVKSFHQGVHNGVLDHLGRFYGYFAYSNANDGGGWHYYIYIKGLSITPDPGLTTHASSNMALQTSADSLTYLRQANGIWRTEYVWYYDEEIIDWRPIYILYDVGTDMIWTIQRADETVVPMNVGNVTIQQIPHFADLRTIDSTHVGVTASAVGNGIIRLSHPLVPNFYNVDVKVSPLYIRPTTGACGDVVVEGTVLQFESNGGQGGVFTATGGTILSGLRWQAPYGNLGIIDFTYTIGNVTANCQLQVVKKLEVAGVDEDGYYPDIAQGEQVQFQATCPGAIFRSTNYPGIVDLRGLLVAPTDTDDDFFGEKTVTIRVTGCGQTYEFKIRVQPMFPIPKFCGPTPNKWRQNEPDFMPNTVTMAGGTSQVKNRNKEGVITWDIDYNPLIETIPEGCTCDAILPVGHLPTCKSQLATADRLSNFYKQVSFTRYFSVVDYHTGQLFKYVRLTEFSRDHVLFSSEQSRRLKMRYEGIPLTAIVIPITTPDSDDNLIVPVSEMPDGGLTYGEPLIMYGEDGLTYL